MSARRRQGFTLLEITMVFAVLAVTALFVIPQWMRANDEPPQDATTAFLALLRDARRVSIEARQRVDVYVDPMSGQYRVDTTGGAGTGVFAEGALAVGALETIESDQDRVRFVFQPTGAAFGDTVVVRGTQGAAQLSVDPWNGTAVAHAR